MTPNVLVVSRDPMLLQTRQLILGTFFQVHGAERMREAEALMSRYSFDLIVLCYTLPESERRAVMNLVANVKRPARILLLSPVGSLPEDAMPGQAAMTEAGPYYLLKKSAEMLGVDVKVKADLVEV
jgi:DNA-binding response OmpR family regulator